MISLKINRYYLPSFIVEGIGPSQDLGVFQGREETLVPSSATLPQPVINSEQNAKASRQYTSERILFDLSQLIDT